MSPFNYAPDMQTANVTDTWGPFGTFEYSTSGAPTDTNYRGVSDTIYQPNQAGQHFIPVTCQISPTISVGPHLNERQVSGYDGPYNNTNLIVPVPSGNTAYLMDLKSNQGPDNYWAIASKLQNSPDPLNFFGPQSSMYGFCFNNLIVDPVMSDAPFLLPYGSASHTNSPPVQLPTPVPNSHGPGAFFPRRQTRKRRIRPNASAPRILTCTTCWGLEKKCEGPTYCSRCTKKGIPAELCIRARLKDVLTFDKYLRDEYKSKVVYTPCNKSKEFSTVTLSHDPNGCTVKVKCYQFVPDLKIPHQTSTFWQGPNGYEEIETTTWSLTNDSLNLDLEPYIEENIPVFVQRACNGPTETAVIFQQAWKLVDRPIIFLVFKIHVALEMLMKGWCISSNEHLGMPTLHAEGAPCDSEIPVPAVMERQLDHMFEVLLAKWESEFCKNWESLAKKKLGSWRTELFLATFLISHVMERDALRLKIRFGSREAMNGWKHPSTPTDLVQKTIHFCNTLYAHIYALHSKDPLRSDCLDEDLRWYTGNEPIAFSIMQTLREHKIHHLDPNSLINRKFCDRYQPGENKSCDFTWSSVLFGPATLIRMKDYLGESVLG